jgi:PUA-domain protein
MVRKQFSKSDIKQFLEEHSFAQLIMDKKSSVVLDDDVLFVDKEMCFIHKDGSWFPTVKLLLKKPFILPKVVVDMGAVKFVVNGADIMRPGIRLCDTFEKGAFVVIVDETHNKPLAVGQALFSSEELLAQTGGKVVSSLHYVGDEYWNK